MASAITSRQAKISNSSRRDYNRALDMERISSRQNPVVKRFREVSRGGHPDLMVLDGEHLLAEAIGSGIQIDTVAFADRPAIGELMHAAERNGASVFTVSAQVLAAISPVREPSGVVAIAAKRHVPLDDAFTKSPALVVILSGVQDPGNVGATIRAAEGCGATGVVCSDATADPFGWKALRGAMGSTFRLPVVAKQPGETAIAKARARGLRVVATTARDGTPLPECDLRGPVAILFGSEGRGLADPLVAAADVRVTIPMQPPVESLNVAVAAALVLYEAARQRRVRH
jgi:TrmH family RNA methyltransferase